MKELSMFEEPMQGKPFLKWAGGKGQLIDSCCHMSYRSSNNYLVANIGKIAETT